jgi:hypothetical protein
VVARASATHVLLPLDIAFLRIVGASLVLLPWAWWLMREQRQKGRRWDRCGACRRCHSGSRFKRVFLAA